MFRCERARAGRSAHRGGAWLVLAAALATARPAHARAQEAGAPPSDELPPGETPPAGADADDADEDPEHEDPDDVAPPTLVPPRLVEASAPAYPEDLEDELVEPTVLVHCVIEPDGTVSAAHPETPHDEAFDRAAVEAVLTWRFAPATRGGVPIRAAVRVSVRFESPIPHFDLAGTHNEYGEGEEAHNTDDARPHVDPSHESATPPAIEEPTPETPEAEVPEFSARGTVDPMAQARAPRASSTYELDRTVLDLAPHRDASDMLNVAPGMFVARAEGDAVAPRIFLRGFDAEHGQDISFSAAGVPINQPSHLHGQGYADLGFVIPEAVRSVRVTEGVYDPRQGDFATAGSVDFDLGVARRGVLTSAAYGMFHTFRGLALWAPAGERDETFVAVTYRRTDGFGAGREGQSGGLLGQVVWGDARSRFRLLAAVTAARAGIGGTLRRDDVSAGRVDFYGLYPVAAAQGQSAFAVRALTAASVELRGERGSFGEVMVFGGWTGFRYQANFTGYTEISTFDPDWRGRGDIVEQTDEAFQIGARARYRTARFDPFDWLSGFVELGVDGRVDLRDQDQNLLQAPLNQTWDQRVDASVQGIDIGAYVDADLHLGEHVRVRGGARADFLFYGVDDRLGNFIPRFRRDSYILGFRRSAAGVAVGPRATVEWTPVRELTLSVAYGEGYRSPQARQLQDGESAPYAKVWSGDVGARLRLGEHDELTASVSGFVTALSRDIAFDPSEGRLEPLGPSTRIGAAAQVRAQPWAWLTGQLSVTYVHATLDAPPVPTIEEPYPPYQPGQLLPYVAPFVLRADLGARERLFDLDGVPFRGRIGAGVSVLSSRPLPYGEHSEPVGLLDASAGVEWHGVELGVDVYNATNSRYAAVEYAYASDWQDATFSNQPDGVTSRLPARHFTAGQPLTVMVQLAVQIP
jgi:iron complex outermembrane receptor protein